MGFKSDIEIAQEAKPQDIREIAKKLDLGEDDIELYGKYKAKVDYNLLKRGNGGKKSKLILTTAINPTPAGEGKTTTTIGVADGLAKLGENVLVALREPSLGPVFGIKGGAAGGGYAQVVPMEDINLHFTRDFHAIGAANNLLAAMLDNHIHQGNELGIDSRSITWRRCVDMNDRQLRNIVDGLGSRADGVAREDGFDITVASEVMAAFCLASDIVDLNNNSSLALSEGLQEALEKPVTSKVVSVDLLNNCKIDDFIFSKEDDNLAVNYKNENADYITIEKMPYFENSILKIKCSVYQLNSSKDNYEDKELIFVSYDNGENWNLQK